MKFKGYRVGIILAVFIVSLGLVIGVNRFTHQRRVIAPIYQVFQAIEGVKSTEIEEQPQGLRVKVTLEQVNELEEVMDEILFQVEELGLLRQVDIVDNPNEALKKTFYKMHFVIEQAVALGNFQEMAETINQIAVAENVTQRMFVNKDYVFIQLHQGDYYLYHTSSRQDGINVKRKSG